MEGRKVAGILAESSWEGNRLLATVLGIGINISTDFQDTPLADKAISLETVTKTPVDRAILLDRLLTRIDYWSIRINQPALMESWRARLDTLGRYVTASSAVGQIYGQASDVDKDGALLIRAEDGTIYRVVA